MLQCCNPGEMTEVVPWENYAHQTDNIYDEITLLKILVHNENRRYYGGSLIDGNDSFWTKAEWVGIY